MTQFIVQGTFDLSTNQLLINFNNVPQLSNNQGSRVPPVLQQSTFIRKPSPHFYTSTLGLVGGVGLLVSCIWSVLLPAIGSVGVITFAYLVNRKITPLHAKELSSATTKAENLFKQQLGNKEDSRSLLDESVNADNLPLPMLPISNVANQSNIPSVPPMPGSGNLVGEPFNPNIPPPPPLPSAPPMLGSGNLVGESFNPNIPPPPPLPSAPPMPLKQEQENRKINSTHIGLMKSDPPENPRQELLSSIRNSFNFMQVKGILKEDSEKYPSNLLLKELKTTYERALAISKLGRFKKWEGYFENKVNSFEKDFPVGKQKENQTIKYTDMEDICEKASHLDSPLKNMQWVKSLLQVLSEREDLHPKTRNHCSEKLKTIDENIKKLQRRDEKKSEEVDGSSTKKANSLETQDSKFNELNITSILARRPALEFSDSSSSEEKSDNGEWD